MIIPKKNVALMVFVAALLALASWAIQKKISSDTLMEIERILVTVRDTAHLAVRSWVDQHEAAALVWANTPEVHAQAARLLELPRQKSVLLGAPAQYALRHWFRRIQNASSYQGFFVVGPDNINLASSRDQNLGVENLLVAQKNFLDRVWAGKTAVSLPIESDVPLPDSDGNLVHGLPSMFVAAPVLDETRKVVAIFMLRLRPEEGFTSILKQGRIGHSGETYAFDKHGHLISQSRFDAQLRELGLIPPDQRAILNIVLRDPGVDLTQGAKPSSPGEQQSLTRMAASAIKGGSGVLLNGYRDYRGVPVVSAWVWDPVLEMGIATEFDEGEAFQTLRATKLAITAFSVLVFLLLLALMTISTVSRQRKAAEKLARKERDTAELYLDTVEAIIVALDADGNISLINRRGCQLLEYPEQDLVGKNWFTTCLPDKEQERVSEVFRAIIHGRMIHVDYYENEIVTRSGKQRLIAWHNNYLRDAGGNTVGALAAGEDITERKHAEEALRENEARFRLLVENIGKEYLIFRQAFDGSFQYLSPAIEEFAGISADDAVGKKWWELFNLSPDTEKELREHDVNSEKGISSPAYEVNYIHRDGTERTVEIVERPELDESGVPVAILGMVKDITERRKVEEELRRAATVFQNTDEGIIVTNADADIILVNKAFTNITGYKSEDVLGKNPRLQQSGRHEREFFEQMWRQLQSSGQWRGEIWNRRENGDVYPAWENINVVRDEQGKITNYVAIFSDISVIKESEERLAHLAHHDTLTGLPNRLRFIANLEQAIESAKRHKHKVALMYLDLDRFKNFNDLLGHNFGDRLLQTVAERLRSCVRAEDTVARLGGDEFTIILTEIAHAENAGLIADKLVKSVRQPVLLDGETLETSTSVGISIYPDDAGDCDKMVKAADVAMYHAKTSGRNNFQFFTEELASRSVQQAAIEKGLRQALERNEFELHYQPQVDIKSGKISGIEALIRWKHPVHGQLLPDEFIQIADDTGLIDPISEWVLRTAFQDLRQWQGNGQQGPRVAVNISGRQITTERSIKRILTVLDELSIEPDVLQLDLEITETALERTGRTIGVINELKARGVMFAIDDFGTGHSSLSRLKQLPIDTLKIDRSFIKEISTDNDDKAIASAIIAMAHNLGLRVIGEGVETDAQLAVLRSLDCDEFQGFYFSRPVNAPEISKMLAQQDFATKPNSN